MGIRSASGTAFAAVVVVLTLGQPAHAAAPNIDHEAICRPWPYLPCDRPDRPDRDRDRDRGHSEFEEIEEFENYEEFYEDISRRAHRDRREIVRTRPQKSVVAPARKRDRLPATGTSALLVGIAGAGLLAGGIVIRSARRRNVRYY